MKIFGKNAVLERLKSGGGFNKIELLSGGAHDDRVTEILDRAKKSGVNVRLCDKKTLDRSAEGARHQGCIGYAVDFEYAELDDIFERANAQSVPPFIVILDGIEDPHNFGSILRSCECGGVHGVVIGKNRQTPVNDTVIKVAEGAAEYVKVVRAVNINDAIREIKKRGVWVYALDMDGHDIYSEDISGATALVVGAEGKGVSRLTRELCDGVLSLPMRGKINSLNASVAAALGIYAKLECDGKKAK
ncbi:MAG: 23S rRNA (guanosine(2251)-2'-O)-methyltransferase RlmB [Clostridiales bacterium]|nr:23S rRNA (guanosine(2251)-2'-O)-methyltransferase RlmB [Clostridiales bacterium]